MKKRIKYMIFLGFVCAGFFFSSFPESYAKEMESIPKKGSVTTYLNEDDGQEKTRELLKKPDSSESKNNSSSIVIVPQSETAPSSPTPLKPEKKQTTADIIRVNETTESSDKDTEEKVVVETKNEKTETEKEVIQNESSMQASSEDLSLPVLSLYLIILILCITFLVFVIRRKFK